MAVPLYIETSSRKTVSSEVIFTVPCEDSGIADGLLTTVFLDADCHVALGDFGLAVRARKGRREQLGVCGVSLGRREKVSSHAAHENLPTASRRLAT